MSRRWYGFRGAKEQKCIIGYKPKKKETLELPFPKLQTVVKSIEALSRNRDPNMTQNEHVHAICCRLEVDDDVTSGGNIESVHCEGAIFSTFWDFPTRSFCGGDGSGCMDEICSRPEVADDGISGTDVDTFQFQAFFLYL